MAENNHGMTPEKKKKQRKILKAENQLLDESRLQFERLYADDPEQLQAKVGMIDEFKKQNLEMGLKMLGADQKAIENETYSEPTDHYKDVYRKRLAMRGVTDEEMRRKDISNTMSATISSESKGETKEKKKFSFQNLLGKKKEKSNEKESNIESSVKETVERVSDAVEEKTKGAEEHVEKKPEKEEVQMSQKENERHFELPKEENSVSFDAGSIPDYIQYDIIDLPSKGECYKHKKSRIPVRYLTAADENLITSPNMYVNGTLIDTILKRCILDKDFNVDEMCQGDKDAVVLWLRMTAFGNNYPVTVANSSNTKTYECDVDLSQLKYKEFSLKGDENGLFTYKAANGDILKWKIIGLKELRDIQDRTAEEIIGETQYRIFKSSNELKEYASGLLENEENNALKDAIDYIQSWVAQNSKSEDKNEDLELKLATQNLINRTVSINGNTDRKYIEGYITNMRIKESITYRNYMVENNPGVDLSVHFDIPESDGGGSIDSFLNYYDDIFINGIQYSR